MRRVRAVDPIAVMQTLNAAVGVDGFAVAA
jgi:hypothetical protein